MFLQGSFPLTALTIFIDPPVLMVTFFLQKPDKNNHLHLHLVIIIIKTTISFKEGEPLSNRANTLFKCALGGNRTGLKL
jgi:hypothetical protein